MTDLPYLRSAAEAGRGRRSITWVSVLYAAAAVAGGGGLAVAVAAPPSDGLEWQLALLLRFMALVKGTMVLGALALTHWRLRQPIGDGLAAGFVGAVTLMLLAPGLIWSFAHIALGAGLFHAGLLAFLLLAWRDDAAGRLLSHRKAAVDRRT